MVQQGHHLIFKQ